MIVASSFKGQKVAVFGLGGSGLATAQSLVEGGADVIAWDDNPKSVENAEAQSIPTQDFHDVDFTKLQALVLAPGVPLTHPQPHWSVELAHKAGIEIIGDLEIFIRERNYLRKHLPVLDEEFAPIVAITGTNGKSTTTALISHIIAHSHRKIEMGGNIGTAALSLNPFEQDTVYVIECSSYQIDLAPSFAPEIGILLNLAPDHLDRHGEMANYAEIKSRLVAQSNLGIIGVDDEYCLAIAEKLMGGENKIVKISNNTSSISDVHYNSAEEIIAGGKKAASIKGIGALRGRHNGQNASAAYAACRGIGLDESEIQAGFSSFGGLVHRMEQVAALGELLFVNDSKATNADAAAQALSSYDNIYWIAGGLPKSDGIEKLCQYFHKINKAYLIGEAAPQFSVTLSSGDEAIDYEISATLDQAVKNATRDALDGLVNGLENAVILFSPACASFDQFPNFEVRGDAFKTEVMKLPDISACSI
jgi:UDP-N-acetylmuramoylalanine--D-glutamate ligase